ncbi:MAG: hypothetical protein ICV83_02080 [Cytophagales bacterium]|nr:hypothetical protein [Cytophagales bacterium]
MKKLYGILFIFLLSGKIAPAQNPNPSISDLQTPVSPGFVLADETPSSVNRPTNPRGLVASLLTLNRGGALEATPYWLLPIEQRKNLTFDKYTDNHFPVIQTFSLSATSLRSDTASYLSVGGRFHLVRFFNKTQVNSLRDSLIALLTPRLGPDGKPLPLDTRRIEEYRDSLGRVRPTLLVEVAGAWLGYSPANTFDQIGNARNGIWANIAYKPVQTFNLIGLARYINDRTRENFSQEAEFLDLGVSVGYEDNKNFTLNGEFVFRNNLLTDKGTHRLALVANYRIIEELYVVGSFGKNFGQVENLIALFGVNLGLSTKPIKLR